MRARVGIGLVVLGVVAAVVLGVVGSTKTVAARAPEQLTTEGMRPLAGQQVTCGASRQKTFAVDIRETTVDLGNNITFAAWTFGGGLPAQTIEACEGDDVTINVVNHGTALHGLDSHALRAGTANFGPVAANQTMTIHKVVDTPGVYMYHCAAGMMTDVHVKRGMAGAMIVYPRNERLRPARELVVVQSAVYGEPDDSGFIAGADAGKAMMKNEPSFMMYNGRLQHNMLSVAPGDLIRTYFVNVGPGTAAVHVMGTILDRVTDGTQHVDNVQTYGVPAGGGAIVEFRIPEKGTFGLVDHDRLAFLPLGLMLGFTTESGHEAHTM